MLGLIWSERKRGHISYLHCMWASWGKRKSRMMLEEQKTLFFTHPHTETDFFSFFNPSLCVFTPLLVPCREWWEGVPVPAEGSRRSAPGRASHAAVWSRQLPAAQQRWHLQEKPHVRTLSSPPFPCQAFSSEGLVTTGGSVFSWI